MSSTASQRMTPDPGQADTKHYTVEFENEKVRVLRAKYGPHEKSPMHGHPALVAVCLTPHYSRHQFSDATVKEMRGHTGDIGTWTKRSTPPENMSDEAMELILVELKG